ncbi:uncharacterized protein [Euwallacea similis]|uniref:uncharacterized protein isoform X2 n=1 Tax=Euwallacea similis TaxID=1736056 RepID=UPI00344CDA09
MQTTCVIRLIIQSNLMNVHAVEQWLRTMSKKFLFIAAFVLLQDITEQSLKECMPPSRVIKYYRLKSCHKSTSKVVFWKHVNSLQECKVLARQKAGLAFNFSPPGAESYAKPFIPNCQVLGCPEIENDSSSLIADLGYDYYSAYGNLNVTENGTCVQSLGVFALTPNYQNYSQSILACQNISGDLADVSSEYRTVMLSQVLEDTLSTWYKAAFVGLDDTDREGVFRIGSGMLLTCSNYRAWAPGHPRSKHDSEDCVALGSDKMWRTVKCNRVKLQGLCELYPHPPEIEESVPKNISCSLRTKKRKCLRQKQFFELFHNSTRPDKCALLNYEERNKSMALN